MKTVYDAIREFIRSGESADPYWVTRQNSNLAEVNGFEQFQSILRYRDNDGRPVVISVTDYGIDGEYLNVIVEESAMYLIRSAYEQLRECFSWRSVGGENEADRLDRMLRVHGAPPLLDMAMPWSSHDQRIIRAKLSIYSDRYVAYDKYGWACFADVEDAVLDKLKREVDPGLFDAGPYMVGDFVVT